MKVYLAGPDVFLPDPLKVGKAKQDICQKYGLIGLFPFDPALDLANLTPFEAGIAIYCSNIALMNDCDLMIANMTPFRGVSLDVGTAFEIGYMAGIGKPIFAYSNDGRLYCDRVPASQPGWDEQGQSIESFAMHDNLMLEGAIYTSGGTFRCQQIDSAVYYTDLQIFERIVEIAAKQLLEPVQATSGPRI